jgi:predicted CxxxxCH...CXXCH cytochrome family protein
VCPSGQACSGGQCGGGTDAGTTALDCATCHTSANLSAAHVVHIDGGSSSSPFPCSECHTLYTSLSHESPTAMIAFATAAGDIANLGGLSPTWNAGTATCSSVYCHGGGTTITDGTNTTPNWSITDGSQDQCNSCHGDPPVANSHLQSTTDFCNVCHLDAIQGGIIVPSLNLHVNGAIDVMPESQWGTNDHGLGTPPPGHSTGNVDFSSCVVCHGPTPPGLPNVVQEVMTCTSCHAAGGP